MAAGTEEMVTWLEDLLRAGLAGTVRDLATLRHAHADWPTRLLGRLGELYLLARAFLNLSQLGPAARADVLLQVGVVSSDYMLTGIRQGPRSDFPAGLFPC